MTGDDFTNEEFEPKPNDGFVSDNPIKEGEQTIGVILASERLDVRYYPKMNVQDGLNQIRGKIDSTQKFRLLLDGKVASLDSVIPNENAEIIFVGNWVLGDKKKV